MAYKNFKKTEIIDELGIELRRVRNEHALTLAQVAGALEKGGTPISSIMLGRIETGQRRIDDDLFHALCDYYDADPNEITVKACQAHITSLQRADATAASDEADAHWLVEAYEKLPPNRQADVRTMLRMFDYLEQFSILDAPRGRS